jgi:ABC-2 type transport system permease protein
VGAGVLVVTLPFASVPVEHPFWAAGFALAGCAILGTMGLLAGIWAEKFDQLAAFQSFVIMPLTFLAGVFYSIHSLPAFWARASRLNPFFYMIDGFRYGFFGVSDVEPLVSLAIVGVFLAGLAAITLGLLKTGYRLRH